MADNYGRTQSKFGAGVHTAQIKSIKFDETKGGIEIVSVLFTDPKGNLVIDKVIWFPKYDQVTPREDQTKDDAIASARRQFTAQFYTILDAVNGEDPADGSKTDKEFAQKCIAIINKHLNKPLLLVVQLDKEDKWSEVPKFRFVYPIDTPKESLDLSKVNFGKSAKEEKKESKGNRAPADDDELPF